MSKVASDGMSDGGLDASAACTVITVCAGQPTSQVDIAARALASGVVGPGDFSKANGDVSGRKITCAQQADLSISSSGTADHVAIDDGTDYFVTTCGAQALTAGGTVTVGAWDREIADPT